jgi:type I restriction enzyme M protein
MSEDLVARAAKRLGRFGYLSLGSTTLAQLKRSQFIRSKLSTSEEQRKPDGIVFLPLGGIKAVVEVKQPSELTASKVPGVVAHYSPIARAVCKLLILTDGEKTLWYNALSERPILDEQGRQVRTHFDAARIDGQKLTPEEESALVSLIEKADYSLTEENDRFQSLRIIDPSGLARSVWQKIWINTGKEPEKCLYNVVEILVFKFLSDLGVLTGNHAFRRVIEILADQGSEDALDHYARVCRVRVQKLFPKGDDGTTIINGTIFVNEKGVPNASQAGLFGEVVEAFQEFDDQHGSLKYIDRQFKTRLYESFLRQSAGIRALGQYFTPRNIVQPMVRMANAGKLKAGDALCDPFCGVGGFILEAIAENANLLRQFRPSGGKVRPKIYFRGYDKGTDEKEDERTIILAKANMLVYVSDLLAEFHSEAYLKEFARNAFNDVFQLLRSNLGTYEKVDEEERYDLILTNPPYVTSGSASIKGALEAGGFAKHYAEIGRGTESLAIQWSINHLKPSGEVYVIVPDGLMNQAAMLRHIKERCHVLGVVSLPSRAFYATPKKTYILALRRKDQPSDVQTASVFTYLVSEIGESRDSRRAHIDANDMPTMEREFALFGASPKYASRDPRCKILSWDDFDALPNWQVDRNWSHQERVGLGLAEQVVELDGDAFRALVREAKGALDRLYEELS